MDKKQKNNHQYLYKRTQLFIILSSYRCVASTNIWNQYQCCLINLIRCFGMSQKCIELNKNSCILLKPDFIFHFLSTDYIDCTILKYYSLIYIKILYLEELSCKAVEDENETCHLEGRNRSSNTT